MFERKIDTGSAEFFDCKEAVERYARHMKKHAGMYKEYLKDLQTLEPGPRMLEIGAGTGLLTWQIAHAYPQAQITALELSPRMAEYGREFVRERGFGERVTWIIGDARDQELIAGLGKFDLIYSSLVLHEFKEPEPLIRMLYAALAPGGALTFLDLRRVWWLHWLPFKNGFLTGIRAAFQPAEIVSIFRELNAYSWVIRSGFPFLLVGIARKPGRPAADI